MFGDEFLSLGYAAYRTRRVRVVVSRTLTDMSGEDEKVKEEEEELDCGHPEVVNKYQFAGNVDNGT